MKKLHATDWLHKHSLVSVSQLHTSLASKAHSSEMLANRLTSGPPRSDEDSRRLELVIVTAELATLGCCMHKALAVSAHTLLVMPVFAVQQHL